jgi:hypothetical protein
MKALRTNVRKGKTKSILSLSYSCAIKVMGVQPGPGHRFELPRGNKFTRLQSPSSSQPSPKLLSS